MSTVTPPLDPETDPRVKAVFDDIRATRKTDFINNMWLWLAFDPDLLERTWAEVKAVMATPSALDPLVKEMLYIAVSVTNGCGYCIHSHTAAAKAKGMSEAEHADLLRVISLAASTAGSRRSGLRLHGRPIADRITTLKHQSFHRLALIRRDSGIKEEHPFWPFGPESLHWAA
jgi:AhpD family alkylhydroperoxidase